MTTDTMHRPTPEFRDFLEGEITREFRSQRSFARLRVAAVLLATLAAGTTAGLASAQIRQGAQRDSLLESANSDLYLAGLRLQLARSAVDDVRQRQQVGAARPEQLAQAEAELRRMEAMAYRAKLNVDEIKVSSMAPRDDLNAPLVGSRDFVTERLQADLLAAQQGLTSAEQAASEVERQHRAGVVGELAVQEATLRVAQARAALGSLVERQKLRKEFIEKSTSGEELNRKYQEAQMRYDVMVAQEAMKLSGQRLETLTRQRAVGVASELEVLRAQVELKEKEMELEMLVRQLRQIRKPN